MLQFLPAELQLCFNFVDPIFELKFRQSNIRTTVAPDKHSRVIKIIVQLYFLAI